MLRFPRYPRLSTRLSSRSTRTTTEFPEPLQVAASDDPRTVTLYVEGTHESWGMNDVEVIVAFTPRNTTRSASQSYSLTVAPVINSFTNSIPNPSINFVDAEH